MRNWPFFALLVPALAGADVDGDFYEGAPYRGPDKEDVALLEVHESSLYGSDNPLSVKIKNDSGFYLDRIAIVCTITDERGYRLFKEIQFQSSPSFSLRMDFPPVTTPELGIPPAAVASVGLYTDDNRWTRGHGSYAYDCRLNDVDGRE